MKPFVTIATCMIMAFTLICSTALAKAPPPEIFGENARIHDAALSPNGKELAVIESIEGKWIIRILSIDGSDKALRAKVIGADVKPGWVKWANDKQVLLDLSKTEKIGKVPGWFGYIYTLNTQSMDGKLLIKPPRDEIRQFNNNVVDFLPDDPDHILMAFSTKDFNNRQPGVKKVNVETGRHSSVMRGRANIQKWHTDHSGMVRVGQGLDDNLKGELRYKMIIRDPGTDKWRDSTEFTGLSAGIEVHGFTKNSNEMIVGRRKKGRNTTGLYIYDLVAKAYTKTLFENPTYDASGIVLNADGSEVIGARYTAEESEVELFNDNSTILDRLRQQNDGYTIDFIDQSADKHMLLYRKSNAYDPGYLGMIDGRTMEEKIIAQYRAELPSESLGLVVSAKYTARDGAKIPAFVTVPPNLEGKKLNNVPFIILPHGGPYARTSKRFDTYSQFFASRGYAVLQMNFRGSAGYGKAFEKAGRENWELMLNDVEDGARWLIEKGYTSPEKMCVAGWSFGGYAALMEAIEHPDLYSCVLSMAAVTDLRDLLHDLRKYRFGNIQGKNSILSGFDSKKDLKRYSPAKRASEMTLPTFIAHGTYDQAVHYDQFLRMKNGLKKSSADVTSVTFKDEDHYLSNEKNAKKFYQAMDKFLTKHMGVSPYIQK